MYPNVLFSTAAHCLPVPASYEYHNRIINSVVPTAAAAVDDNSRPLICDRPAHFSEVQEPIYQKSNDDKSISNTSTVQHVVQPIHPVREMPCPSLSLMPIYHSDTNVPLFSELFRLQASQLPVRSVDIQPFTQQMMAPTPSAFDNKQLIPANVMMANNDQRRDDHAAYLSNRIGYDLSNSYHINDGLNPSKYLSSIPSSGNYASVITSQSKLSFDVPLTKLADNFQSQAGNSLQTFTNIQPYSSIGYANQPQPQPQHTHYTTAKSQFSLIEDATIQKSAATVSTSVANTLTSQQQQVHKPMPSYASSQAMSNYASYNRPLLNETVNASVYDLNTNVARTDDIQLRETISIGNEKNVEKSTTDKTTAQWKNDTLDDVYSYDKDDDDYSVTTHVESVDSTIRKSMNIPSVTDANNLSSLAHSPATNINGHRDIQHISLTAPSTTSNGMPKDEHYRNATIDTNYIPNYNELLSNVTHQPNAETATSHFSTSYDNQDRSNRFGDKRRSSIDSASMVKSLDDDNDLLKKSIAANVRRRYSVAANLVDLEKNRTNMEPFYLQSSPAINYQNDANNPTDMNRSNLTNEQFDTAANVVSTFGTVGEDKRNSIDLGVKIEDIAENHGYDNRQISDANITISHQPIVAIPANENGHGHIETTDVNQSNIDGYYVDEGDVATAATAESSLYGAAYSTYESDDQAFVENAMGNLHLNDTVDQHLTDELQLKSYDDGTDKIRIPGTHRYVHCSLKFNFTRIKLIEYC